jgi:hypothetical protein
MRSNKRPCFLYRLSACVVLLVWMCSGSPVWAEEKMDSALLRALGAMGDAERLGTIAGVFYRDGAPHVKLFLQISEIPPELEKAGVELRSQSGDIYTATAPLENLMQVAELP